MPRTTTGLAGAANEQCSNTVWCWGNNANGELGQGNLAPLQYPTKVLGFANPTKLVAADYGCFDSAFGGCSRSMVTNRVLFVAVFRQSG